MSLGYESPLGERVAPYSGHQLAEFARNATFANADDEARLRAFGAAMAEAWDTPEGQAGYCLSILANARIDMCWREFNRESSWLPSVPDCRHSRKDAEVAFRGIVRNWGDDEVAQQDAPAIEPEFIGGAMAAAFAKGRRK